MSDLKLLVYGLNYEPELTGVGKYTGEMARWFAENGCETRVITAVPYYPNWSLLEGFRNSYSSHTVSGTLKIIRCPLYIPRTPKMLPRLVHLFSFVLTSFFPLLAQIFWAPRVVMVIAPTMLCCLQALIVSRLSGATSVLHIQDYETEMFFKAGLLSQSRLVSRLLLRLERFILRRFDVVSSISEPMVSKAINKGVRAGKTVLCPNWAEPIEPEPTDPSINYLDALGLDSKNKTVLYSGNLGRKQGLEVILDLAEKLQTHDIQFLVIGAGEAKKNLEKLSEERSLKNITFADLQPKAQFFGVLKAVDVHLVPQMHGIGDSVLPSKLTNILGVGGNAVIGADSDSALGYLVRDFPGIAVRVKPGSPDAMVAGVLEALEMEKPNETAITYAQAHLNKQNILRHYLYQISNTPKEPH